MFLKLTDCEKECHQIWRLFWQAAYKAILLSHVSITFEKVGTEVSTMSEEVTKTTTLYSHLSLTDLSSTIHHTQHPLTFMEPT